MVLLYGGWGCEWEGGGGGRRGVGEGGDMRREGRGLGMDGWMCVYIRCLGEGGKRKQNRTKLHKEREVSKQAWRLAFSSVGLFVYLSIYLSYTISHPSQSRR